MKVIPFIPDEIIKYLSEAFPDVAPEAGESITSIRHKAGQASVVRFLIQKKQQQDKKGE